MSTGRVSEETDCSEPQQIGPYRILRSIASGGTAEVFEVEDLASGEHLALKLLRRACHERVGQRFDREYTAMVRLDHPNIVRVYHYGLHGQRPWLTMELVHGTPVQGYIRRLGRPGTPRRSAECIRVARDLASALAHIHDRGLVHRDLKSANVLVLPDGRVKMLDFGCVQVAGAEGLTQNGEFVGTFAYASPEQFLGKSVDGRSDLYSLGVLLYRMVTGETPFRATDLRELTRQHLGEAPRPPSEQVAVAPELEAVILKLLQKSPRKRPRSGWEVVRALQSVQSGEPEAGHGVDLHRGDEVLVGRENELTTLNRFLGAREPGACAIIVGPEGSGRERVQMAVEREAGQQGYGVARCILDSASWQRFLLMLNTLVPARTSEASRSAVGVIRAALRSADGGEPELSELVEAALALLCGRVELDDAPLLLSLTACHRASPLLIRLIAEVREVLFREGVPVLFVGEFDEAYDRAGIPLRVRIPDAVRIELEPLTEQQVALLVGSLLHRRPPPALVARRIREVSGGLPRYVELVIEDLLRGGVLEPDRENPNQIAWARYATLDVAIPKEAVDLIEARLQAVPVIQQRILEVLALLGVPSSPEQIAHGLSAAPDEVRFDLQRLRAAGWVERERYERAPFFAIRRPLGRAVILERIPARRRAVYEAAIATGIRKGQSSYHQIPVLVATGELAAAVRQARRWGEALVEELRPLTALEFLEPVVDALGDVPDLPVDEVAKVHLLYAVCLALARPLDRRGADSLRRVTALTPDGRFAARVELIRAEQQRSAGQVLAYRSHLEAAWAHLGEEPASRLAATISTRLFASFLSSGAPREAAAWRERIATLALRDGSMSVKARAEVVSASWYLSRGDLELSERLAVDALDVFDRTQDVEGISLVVPIWSRCLMLQGRFSRVIDVLGQLVPDYRNLESPELYLRLLVALARCEVELCRLGRSRELLDELTATLRAGEVLELRLSAELVKGRVLIVSGLLREAVACLGAVVEQGSAAGLVLLAEEARAALGEAQWGCGERAASRVSFDTALGRLRAAGDVPALMEGCRCAARALGDQVPPDQLFGPVVDTVRRQPAEVTRLEWAISAARHMAAQSRDAESAWKRAVALFEDLLGGLNTTDQAALRVHPWARQIRLGLGELGTGPRGR